MTFEELCWTLPNGLHDAALRAVRIDYDRREAVLDVDVDIGGRDLHPPEQYMRGQLRFTGLAFLVIDPPDPACRQFEPAWINAGTGQPSTSPVGLPPLPARTFLCWIFVNDWNSFIRIAAASVTFERGADVSTGLGTASDTR